MWYYYADSLGMCESDTPHPLYKPTQDEAMIDFLKKEITELNEDIKNARLTIDFSEARVQKLMDKYGYLMEEYPEYFV